MSFTARSAFATSTATASELIRYDAPAPSIPTGLVAHLSWNLSYVDEPRLSRAEQSGVGAVLGQLSDAANARQGELRTWLDATWRPWSRAAAAADATRRLHDKLYDLRYRLDVDAARLDLALGRPILVVDSTDIDADGKPVLTTRARFAAERVEFVVENA